METSTQNKIVVLRNLYFYLVSFVTLMIMVFAGSSFVNAVLRTYVFTSANPYMYYPPAIPVPTPECQNANASTSTLAMCAKQKTEQEKQELANRENQEKQAKAQNQQEIVNNLTLLIITLPLFVLHFRAARKEV